MHVQITWNFTEMQMSLGRPQGLDGSKLSVSTKFTSVLLPMSANHKLKSKKLNQLSSPFCSFWGHCHYNPCHKGSSRCFWPALSCKSPNCYPNFSRPLSYAVLPLILHSPIPFFGVFSSSLVIFLGLLQIASQTSSVHRTLLHNKHRNAIIRDEDCSFWVDLMCFPQNRVVKALFPNPGAVGRCREHSEEGLVEEVV